MGSRVVHACRGIGAAGYGLAALASLVLVACHPGVPVVDTGPKPAHPNGTIAGSVRGPQNSAPAVDRLVAAVGIDTGRRFQARTDKAGSYTIEVPPGRYRLEVELHEGERLQTRPDEVQVDASDVDSDRDFVLVGPGEGLEGTGRADPRPGARPGIATKAVTASPRATV
jgi:hypothetical protein